MVAAVLRTRLAGPAFDLVVVVGYLRSLLDNAAVVRFLSQAEPAMLGKFQEIADLASMKATG